MEGFFTVLLRIGLLGSLSAVLLIMLQPVLRRLAGWTAVYYLWLAVLLRLCIPAGITVPLPGHTGVSDSAGSISADHKGSVGPEDRNGALYTVEAFRELNKAGSGSKWNEAGRKEADMSEAGASEAAADTAERELLSAGKLPDIWPFGNIFWLVLWGTGVCAYLGWHIWAVRRFSRKVQQSLTEAPEEASAVLRRLEPEGRIHLKESDMVHTPMLLGLLHPVIILPKGMGEKNTQMLQDIMAHELVHAKRHDLAYKWFVAAATALHWFNPLMILVRREIGRSCELSCDESVIRGMNSCERRHYGETLLAVAGEPVSGAGAITLSLCEEKTRLKERLISIGKYKKRGICAAVLSLLPIMAVTGCAMVSGAGISGADSGQETVFTERADSGQEAVSTKQADSGDAGSENRERLGSGAGTDRAENGETDGQAASEDYLDVLTGKKQLLYYAEGGDNVQSVNIADIPALFSPDSSYAEIYEYAVADLDGDGEPEVILHITDVAGDMGGFIILRRQNGKIHGYSAGYQTFSSLKTDGTFQYTSPAAADDGIGTVRFHETGYTVVPLACSQTDEDQRTTVYLKGGQPVSEEEFLAEKEEHGTKTDVVWFRFTDQNIQRFGEQTDLKNGTEYDQTDEESAADGPELYYEKDGMQYELAEDLITGKYSWASVLSPGTLVKDSHGHKHQDYYEQERRFEKVDGSGKKESYTVRRWDSLLYSAGEYLIFEYDGIIHVSKSTDLYHPVLSYEHGGTYGIITRVPQGYMIADDRSYEIRFYDEQFKPIQVITGLRAGESGHYYQDGLMAVRDMETGLEGFMDQKGRLVIPCSYAAVSDFSNGYASVLADAEIVPYTEDSGTVQMFYGKGGQWGIIDRKGQFAIEPSPEYANESPDAADIVYCPGIRRFGPVREDGTVDFIASDQEERVLKTVSVW